MSTDRPTDPVPAPPGGGAKAARSAATRARLIAVARPLFAERGYAAVGTEEIVRTAGVTRGALYHQFADKRALFRAVLETIEEEVIAVAAAELAAHPDDMLAAFKAACRSWLRASATPEVTRVLLVDAPAVLGWEVWREIAEQYGLGVIRASLEHGMETGALARRPVAPLAHALMGALDEAALYVARAEDREAAAEETTAVVDALIDGLAATGG